MKKFEFWRFCVVAGPLLFLVNTARAQTPEWIWNSTKADPGRQTLYFRKSFVVKTAVHEARLTADADDVGDFYINGKLIATVKDWNAPAHVDVTKDLVRGENILAIRGSNDVSAAGILAQLDIRAPGQQKVTIATGTNWLWSDHVAPDWTSLAYDDSHWQPAVSEGKAGVQPWGDVLKPREATAASAIKVEPGFKVELLHSADATEGSWVSMTADDKGRMIISPQSDGLLRITISHGRVEQIERIDQPVNSAMGLLFADHTLYVNGHGPKGTGVYSLREKGNKFEAPVFLRKMEGEGEHGSHGLVLGPDKKLYVVSGNFTKVPADILPTSPLKNYADDQLLPRAADGRGFGNGLLPPGGFVLRMDCDGSHPELFAAGTRNTYDIAFNSDGELFGFDSDMEWDWGASWYRPIRINHWVSGGDYGFREGSGKFPEYYEDTLPANLDVGIGSPTGVMFGDRSNFPEKYRSAFFMLDWAYGRIFAAHLNPEGASYGATLETILRGIPLNLTALDFGRDGALYFITGGRGTESGLYRLTYVGPRIHEHESSWKMEAENDAKLARRLRHDLEFFQGKHDPRIIDIVWPSLNSDDRWIRYAARTALEFQDVTKWQDRAVAEPSKMGGLTALLALARCGSSDTQRPLLLALKKFPFDSLNGEEKLLKLRVIELSFCRQGRPAPDLAKLAIEKLDARFPSNNGPMDHELCQLLLYLRAPDAITKSVALLNKAQTLEDQTFYAMTLRTISNGWTLDERKDYLGWFKKDHDDAKHPPQLLQYFKDAGRDYSDGASMDLFLTNCMKDAIATLTPDEREDLAEYLPKETNSAPVVAKVRKFIKEWKMAELDPLLEKVKASRSFKAGKETFTAAQCVLCHRFGKGGGSVGPELSAVASRLTAHDILESILLPSKVVSDQYKNTIVSTKDGDDVIGRIVEETDQKLVVMTDPIKMTKVDVLKKDVLSRRLSKVSPMPEGLANYMTQDEIFDLIAYLESGGKKTYAAFKK